MNSDMKKAGRSARKKTGICKGPQNMSLPGQVSKQLNKHYVNKYGVVRKSHRVNTQQT